MNARSESALATVSPALAGKVRAAAATLEAAGTHLLVVSGLRTAAQQDALFAQGRTAPGQVVTNAPAGHSMHNYGLAVDIVPYISGESGDLNWRAHTPQFQAMVDALKAKGLAWGGDWIHFKDEDHFQLSNVPANPSQAMIGDYGAGDETALEAIWQNATDGKYQA
ncbi:MAG TPA: M15 family metallopeptidase [Terracidiphilus sp.]|jgi:peptidoglycan L-alanyl-D-glutamate endopeptidase CwlK